MTKRKTPRYTQITNGPVICVKKVKHVKQPTVYRIRYPEIPLAVRRPVAQWVKSIRAILGLDQEEFAELLDVSRDAVAGWEQGRYEPGVYSMSILWNLAFRICVVRTTQIPEELARTVQLPEEHRS